MHSGFVSREAYFLPYGDADAASEVVETFGDLDMEYAALRKGCVIFDEPHVGTIRVTGADRGAFLNNMLTAKLDDLAPGTGTRSFWLNRKGRIDADLRIAQREQEMVFALDRHLCPATTEALNTFVFGEDAQLTDASEHAHRLALHGPTAAALLARAADEPSPPVDELGELGNATIAIADASVLVERDDLTGEVGLELCIPIEAAQRVHARLIETIEAHPELKARESGWLAVNTARIEAGRPLFNLDFGPTNLPVESGIIDQRVHFAKGCYLGQEVVARMHARGACNKRVTALRIEGQRITTANTEIMQPTTGSQVFLVGKEGQTPVGVVTSSTISPMLGAIPICFAMLKADVFAPGTALSVSAEGSMVRASVQKSLRFWERPTP